MNPCAVPGKGMFCELELKSLIAAVLERNVKNWRICLFIAVSGCQKMCSCEVSNKHIGSLDLIISQSHTLLTSATPRC